MKGADNSQVRNRREVRKRRGLRRLGCPVAGGLALLWCLVCCLTAVANAQSSAAVPQHSVVLDRIVADVDGQAILASDVDDEMRFSALQPSLEPAADNTPQRALERVIDRTLIIQQRALQPGVAEISQKEVDQAIADLRHQITVTDHVDCETAAGWKAFLATRGFTPDEIDERMRERLAILKFIDVRFGVVAQVSIADIRNYYDQVLVPELERDKATVPKLSAVASQIREILRQQQVSSLIDVWLKNLRAEGQVQILDSAYGEVEANGEGGQ